MTCFLRSSIDLSLARHPCVDEVLERDRLTVVPFKNLILHSSRNKRVGAYEVIGRHKYALTHFQPVAATQNRRIAVVKAVNLLTTNFKVKEVARMLKAIHAQESLDSARAKNADIVD